MNYQVGDLVARIKNGYQARKKQVIMPYSNITKAIGKALVKEGFLANVDEEEQEGKRVIVLTLRYANRKPAFHDVRLVSKPSIRVYKDVNDIKNDKEKALTAILSTSTGILSGKEAMKKGVGGELLFKIW